jgi:cobalt-zinc-cadmium efflux system protein
MIASKNPETQRRFTYSIILTSLILIAEIVGGIISGSLALLSDAAHVFMDVFALALSFIALRLAMRPPDDRHSFGWHRTEVVAALINGSSLVIISIGIWIEAVKRWQNPVEIRSFEMGVIAIIGLVVNILVAIILGGQSHGHSHSHNDGHNHERVSTPVKKERNLNVQSAFLHVIGDAISSVGVIVAAILIRYTGANWLDPLISILIGVIIFTSAFRILRKSLHILLEGVPTGLSVKHINERINSIPTVDAVHDLHIWNLGSEQISLSAHVILKPDSQLLGAVVMDEIKKLLMDEFQIAHTTVQFEQTPCENGHGGCN